MSPFDAASSAAASASQSAGAAPAPPSPRVTPSYSGNRSSGALRGSLVNAAAGAGAPWPKESGIASLRKAGTGDRSDSISGFDASSASTSSNLRPDESNSKHSSIAPSLPFAREASSGSAWWGARSTPTSLRRTPSLGLLKHDCRAAASLAPWRTAPGFSSNLPGFSGRAAVAVEPYHGQACSRGAPNAVSIHRRIGGIRRQRSAAHPQPLEAASRGRDGGRNRRNLRRPGAVPRTGRTADQAYRRCRGCRAARRSPY